MTARPDCDVVVIGAGFAGLYAVQRLTEAGLKVIAFERGEDVGGVWYWNRYPGARCDCESFYYSYSFSEDLQQAWTWSLRYAEQPEILRYLHHVAERFDLRRHYRFGAAVTGAAFDETAELWRVTPSKGEAVSARFVVTTMGCLSQVNWPDIPGLRDFGGRLLHTAQWPHEAVDFTGRRVGVIGTGASAVQAIPRIARQAARLTVFQRTANWVLPARNRPTEPEFDTWVKANYADIRDRCLSSGGAVPFDPPSQAADDLSPAERDAVFEDRWALGGMRFFTAFTDLFTSETANAAAQAFVRRKILAAVRDPRTAAKLVPSDHPIGVKRPPLDDDYYSTFNLETVDLVDLRQTPIMAVDGGGVRTSQGVYDLDDLVVATGFDAITGPLLALDLRGRGGVRLTDVWREGPRTYLGLGVAGFPNLFTVTGPLSPSVLANMPTAVEHHIDWIADCIAAMARDGRATIEPTAEAEAAWSTHAAEVVAGTLYARSDSWYYGSNIPGKPRAFGVYLGGFDRYREHCEAVAAAGYDGFRFEARRD